MRLVDHVGGREAEPAVGLRVDQLVEDQEQPERVDRAGIQIVVAVLGVVEVEAGEFPAWTRRETIISMFTFGA